MTLPDLELRETHEIVGLHPADAATVVVRASNAHGLSPPSPLSRPMETAAAEEGEGGDARKAREALAAKRVLELKGAEAMGPRKIRLEWEVGKRLLYYTHLLLQ